MCYNASTPLVCLSVHMSVGSMNVYADMEAGGQFHNIRCFPGLFKVLCVGVFRLHGYTTHVHTMPVWGQKRLSEPSELELQMELP